VWKEMEEFDTSSRGVHANWSERFFADVVDAFLSATGNHGGLVGNATCHLLSARALLDFALPVMAEVAEDATAIGRLAG
jgi:hypothetical protein